MKISLKQIQLVILLFTCFLCILIMSCGENLTRNPNFNPNSLLVGQLGNLQKSSETGTSIVLTWAETYSNEVGFIVERSIEDQNHWIEINRLEPNAKQCSDINLDISKMYYYRVKAYNHKESGTYSNIVEFNRQSVATPTFNPAGGIYPSAQSVTISCTTPDVTIRYTTNGSDPTSTSTLYSSPVTVNASTTLKAKAFKTGYNESAIANATYTISIPTVATPTFNPAGGTYPSAQSVIISCATPGATIRYTTNGSDPTSTSTLYSSSVSVNASTTLKAKAFKTGYNQSAIANATYIISIPTVATPTFNPPGGTYSSAQSVTISCATPGATIRYTTNGSDPTSQSPQYSNPLIISNSNTLKAIAFKTGYTTSLISTAYYSIILNDNNMVLVQGGTFQMGSTNGDSDESPIHGITLSTFYIDKYEVTQSEWQAVMGSNPATGAGVGTYFPVYNVNWYAVLVYCNKRSILEGLTPCYAKNGDTNPNNWGSIPTSNNSSWNAITCNWSTNGYRLPTEAEWEYAARGGNQSQGYTYSGSNTIGNVAWYSSNSDNSTHSAGTKAPNELGIYDMSGNVYEWCWDWYGSYSSNAQTNPKGPTNGSHRVSRGGSWNYTFDLSRVVNRDRNYPGSNSNNLGFRLTRSIM